MRVLLTGYEGYIGPVLAPLLVRAGHEVVGLDSGLFSDCTYTGEVAIPSIDKDIRDVARSDLMGFEAVLHLAGLSNDPLGDLNPDLTSSTTRRRYASQNARRPPASDGSSSPRPAATMGRQATTAGRNQPVQPRDALRHFESPGRAGHRCVGIGRVQPDLSAQRDGLWSQTWWRGR